MDFREVQRSTEAIFCLNSRRCCCFHAVIVFGFVLQKVSFPSGCRVSRSVEDATFIGGHHVLDVDEGVFSAMSLEELEGHLDEVTQVGSLSLSVVDLVSEVIVLSLEEVEDGEDLSVVGYESFADGVGAQDEGLEDLEGDLDDLGITSVEGSLDWDNELGDDGKHLGSTLLEHVEDTLDGEESVGVNLLAYTFEENGEVMMVIELGDIHFPVDLVLRSVLDGDGEISSVVEASELGGSNGSAGNGTGSGSGNLGLFLWLGKGVGLTALSISLFESGHSFVCNRSLGRVDGFKRLNSDGFLDSAVLGEVSKGGIFVLGEKLVVVGVESFAT